MTIRQDFPLRVGPSVHRPARPWALPVALALTAGHTAACSDDASSTRCYRDPEGQGGAGGDPGYSASLLPAEEGSPSAGGGPSMNVEGDEWGPPHHRPLPLEPLGDDLHAYVPHSPKAHRVKGSGHTHCAPDHSGIETRAQEERLRDLPDPHRHAFVWMTAHSSVVPDPQVSGITHLFGTEVYTKKYPESQSEPHALAYLPNGALADHDARPFGYFKHDLETLSRLVRDAGGVLAWAHPSRNPLTQAELESIDDLWGMEVVSGATDVEANLAFVDRRLSSGKYVCLTGGGDIHAEDYRLTHGYQLVEVDSTTPSRDELFDAVASCNFFVCSVRNTDVEPIDAPLLFPADDALVFQASTPLERIRFIGADGKVLHETANADSASYAPRLEDRYVRVEAFGANEEASCYSQPVWLLEG